MTERDKYLLVAGVCIVAVWVPLAIGVAFDFFPLLWWGTVGMYLGVGWIVPGGLVGAAFKQSAKSRGEEHPNVAGVVAGVGFTLLFLVVGGALLAGAALRHGDSETDTSADQVWSPNPTQRQAASLVAAAARKSGHGRVQSVFCDTEISSDNLGFCVVTYKGPRCQMWFVGNEAGEKTVAPADDKPLKGLGRYDESVGQVNCC